MTYVMPHEVNKTGILNKMLHYPIALGLDWFYPFILVIGFIGGIVYLMSRENEFPASAFGSGLVMSAFGYILLGAELITPEIEVFLIVVTGVLLIYWKATQRKD